MNNQSLKQREREEQAHDIVNHFFAKGARVSKEDYDFVLAALHQVRAETLKEAEGCVPDEVEEDPSWHLAQIQGFNSCRLQMLSNIRSSTQDKTND